MTRLRGLLPGQKEGSVVYECRNCGTTVTEDTDHCPACNSTGIARYAIQ